MNPEQFRITAYRIVDWIADYRNTIEMLPTQSNIEIGATQAMLPATPPQSAESFEAIIDDLNEIILPGVTHWNHPNFFAYFPANASLSSILGDFVSSGLGIIGLNWQSSPALTELEELTVDWMRQMTGLSDNWHGVIQDSASSSTLVALICARERKSEFGQNRGGLQEEASPLIVYTSDQSHSSVKKAALLSGFGDANVRAIGTNKEFALDVKQLEAAIESDLAAGRTPCAIVATVGTTATTAIDPVADIATIARRYGLWLHVDAAMAGTAMILPECRWMWDGIESADSLVLNAHKWLGVVFDCSLYYMRDPEHLIRVMSTNPSYLRTDADGSATNYRDWGIPLGRRFRALKLWFLIREQGVAGLQARIRRDLENTRWLEAAISAESEWEIVAPVPLQTICVRHRPAELDASELDEHNLAWAAAINASGAAALTPAKVGGQWIVRISIGAEATTLDHVQALWDVIKHEV